ncbi:MAG: hypothetical protein ACFFD4_18375 [Candidatus Odinarchaeota archaeon]
MVNGKAVEKYFERIKDGKKTEVVFSGAVILATPPKTRERKSNEKTSR